MSDLDINRKYYSINIYKYRFLENLPRHYVDRFILLVNENNYQYIHERFPEFKVLVIPSLGPIKRVPLLGKIISIFKHTAFINNSNCHVYFSASNLDFNNLLRLKIKKVAVIHDLKAIWERKGHWDYMFYKFKARFYYKKLISTSDIIISISNYTKKEIERIFPELSKSNKLNVVYNSIPYFDNNKRYKPLKNENYILYVNTLIESKNFITLLKAYNMSKYRNNVGLIVVGKKTDYWISKIVPIIKEFQLESNITLFSNIDDAELNFLYSKAKLFVSPSLNEGFGYTPIEAAMHNCPVICTQCEALPDTTCGKVFYYDNPFDEFELSHKIDYVLENPPTDIELDRISSFYKKRYSPKDQVEKILNLLF